MTSALRTSIPAPTPCPHPRQEPIYDGKLRRCLACDLVATTDPSEFRYDQAYFTAPSGSGYDFDSAFSRAHDEARFRAELERLEVQGLKGSVLDIGCATGTFLAHAQARGWQVAGVEVADFARQRAESRLGVSLAKEVALLPPGARYDVVTLHHVLEHVAEAVPFLRDEVGPRVGRRLLVEVPNFQSLAARVHGSRWRDLRPDQHLYHYTPETLTRLVEQAGLRPVRVYSLWEALWGLRSALESLLLLRGLLPGAGGGPQPWAAPSPALDGGSYRPPRGVKGVATRLSQVLLRPLVRALEARGLGERLVLEAEPPA